MRAKQCLHDAIPLPSLHHAMIAVPGRFLHGYSYSISSLHRMEQYPAGAWLLVKLQASRPLPSVSMFPPGVAVGHPSTQQPQHLHSAWRTEALSFASDFAGLLRTGR